MRHERQHVVGIRTTSIGSRSVNDAAGNTHLLSFMHSQGWSYCGGLQQVSGNRVDERLADRRH
ncbi:hypothetical protein OG474_11415 [Kribbella sp. NBC_01505]|uniref:hypothetical protein n=1 Tax=Kribbella sp. NBC_01505 TaxID=2903580 RepID=UPI00386691BA